MEQTIDKLCINSIRTLVADAIQKAKSGHPGMAIGAAPIGYALFNTMRINPKQPNWVGRDRFVLSSGHASMLLYSLLHLNGYELTIDDIKKFRQFGSKTPGHPEIYQTAGVDVSSGPLGQGFAMAVGLAMASAHEAAVFNRDGYCLVDNCTYVLMGDGCMMEGITYEAASLAGTLKLNKLIAIYDSNAITIEGKTDIAFTEDVAKRFEAQGFLVINVDNGENVNAIANALNTAKTQSEKPALIIVKTHIAHGTKKSDMASAHGEPLGDDCITQMKADMEWNYAPFTVPNEVYAHFENMQAMRDSYVAEYNELFARYAKEYPELAQQWSLWHSDVTPEKANELLKMLDCVPQNTMATRQASGEVLNKLYSTYGITNLFGGSADLGPSNKTIIEPKEFFAADNCDKTNIHFGVRELAMAAICNGMALYGGLIPYCATFMVFADYVKPALRLGALMGLRVLYILTHDSIGVGEDGPTHHPIEQLSALRATPNVNVFRPADYKETVAAYISALTVDCPTVLAMSRQNLPQYDGTGNGALLGGYVVNDCQGMPDVIIISSGSELEISNVATEQLRSEGVKVRLVSMPCMEIFDEQSDEYKNSVLPRAVRARVAVEAGCAMSWYKYVGMDGETVTIDEFGASAPAGVLFEHFGFTSQNVVSAAKRVLGK